jgi:hypothetical protein
MRYTMMIPVLFGTLAFAETRTVNLVNPVDALGSREILTLLRTVADVPSASMDAGRVTIEGSVEQLGRAEWLVHQIDRPADWQPSQQERDNPATREYAGKIRIYFLANTPTPQAMQETLTILRTVLDTQRLFNYSRLHAVVLSGAQTQLDAVEWVLRQIDVPAGSVRVDSGLYRYVEEGPAPFDTVEVFALPDDFTAQRLNEMVRTLRSRPISVMKIFNRTIPPSLVVHATAAQIDQVAQAVAAVRKPAQ